MAISLRTVSVWAWRETRRVEAGVLDGLGDARRRQGEQVKVLSAEVVGLLAFDVHDADEAVLGDQGDG